MGEKSDYVITVMARDRVGIVAGVTGAIGRLSGSVDAMSQTVMRGYFTIIITATFPAGTDPQAVREAVAAGGEPGELEVSIKEWEREAATAPVVEDSEVFVLSIMGKDRPGIVAKIASFLSSRNINIIDLYSYVNDGQLVFISQVMVERGRDLLQLQIDLESLFKKSGMAVHFQHENIFIATNRVDFRGGH